MRLGFIGLGAMGRHMATKLHIYDGDKHRMLDIMHEHTYARAKVDGRVTMDRGGTEAVTTAPALTYT